MSEKYFKCKIRKEKIISNEFFVCSDTEEGARQYLLSLWRGWEIASIVEDKEGANGKTKNPRS